MEQALYATNVEKLKSWNTSFSRIYFGNEFCERLLPSPEEVDATLKFVLENNLSFSFVTPYVTDAGLKRIEKLLAIIAERKPESEVIFNDWGILHVLNLKYPNFEPVIGRLLNKMKRDPRLLIFIDSLPETAIEYFKGLNINVPIFQNFLKEKGVKRVEVDNTLQGVKTNFKNLGFNASLYTPYVYVTTSRLCLAISCNVYGMEDVVGIFPCKKECRKYTSYLKAPVMPVTLIRKGNTVFLKNQEIPKNLEEIGINRLVIEPEIPL
ncbi:MAG: hypothetical protein QW717_05095 [Candidatus Bathyarchaeia archaeon]